jgi:hypothetical protein
LGERGRPILGQVHKISVFRAVIERREWYEMWRAGHPADHIGPSRPLGRRMC